jgi:integrase
MADPTPEPFDPKKFVKGLKSAQLEIMSELHDETAAALRLLTHAGKTFQAPTGKDMLEVFKAAEPELLNRFAAKLDNDDAQVIDGQISWRSDTDQPDQPEKRIPKTPQAEWRRELGHEIEERRSGLALPVVATPDEIQDLFNVYKGEHHRNYLILRTLYASGARREELTNILVADLYPERCIIFIRRGKYDKDRYVFIDQETSALLADYTRDFLLTDKIFDLSTRTINRVVNAAGKQTGLRQRLQAMGRNFSPHSLRHSYASHMYDNGSDTFAIQTLLGHIYLKTTKTYVHIGINALSDRYFQSHPLAAKGPSGPGRTRFPEQIEDEDD